MTLTKELSQQLSTNEKIVLGILQEIIHCGAREICVCPSTRNAPFVTALSKIPYFKQYFWPEERSAAFFALGRSKLTQRPVIVLTTSGTAVAELLPAVMEAYYSGIPLILLTTDRPRHYRGTGAPQAAEQVGIYGQYAVFEQDIAEDETYNFKNWKQNGPAHINVCLDEPLTQKFEDIPAFKLDRTYSHDQVIDSMIENTTAGLNHFVNKCKHPLVIVSTLEKNARAAIVRFLNDYNAPVYLEGASGLREDPRLNHLRIAKADHLLKIAQSKYPIDGILRIGGVPTARLWRDLENMAGKIDVYSISSCPFSGLSWGGIHCLPLALFFEQYSCSVQMPYNPWIEEHRHQPLALIHEEPCAEGSLIHYLSYQIPSSALVYLGNSLPIREWDLYATFDRPHPQVFANRGVNGIDGQISTFLGMCGQEQQNWGIIGDLTAIYDMAAPWILNQMVEIDLNLVIINNGGGKIFDRMFPLKRMQNLHQIHFKSLAELWNMGYECYTQLPEKIPYGGHRIIEIVPDEEATQRFWKRL